VRRSTQKAHYSLAEFGFQPTSISPNPGYSNANMNSAYVIQWKSKVNGRAGKGTKQFDREEALRLVEELNREYPQIHHEVMSTNGQPDPEVEQPAPGPHLLLPVE
jgi:hypothetical protein